jgi:hypothetical protein
MLVEAGGQVHAVHGDARERVERREEAPTDVCREVQEHRAVVLQALITLGGLFGIGIGIGIDGRQVHGELVGGQEATEDADVGLEDTHVEGPGERDVLETFQRVVKPPVLAEQEQRVQALDERQHEAAQGVIEIAPRAVVVPSWLARHGLKLIERECEVNVVVVAVKKGFLDLFPEAQQRGHVPRVPASANQCTGHANGGDRPSPIHRCKL